MVKKLTIKNPLRRKSRQGSASNIGGEGGTTTNNSSAASISSSINANETSTDGGGSQSSTTHHHTNNHNNTNNIVDSVRTVGSSMRSSGTSLSGTKLKIGSSLTSGNNSEQQQPPDEFSPAATSSHVKTIQVPTKLGPPPHQLLTKTSTATDTTDSSGRDRSDTQLISNSTNNNNNNNEGPDIDKAYELIPQLQTIDLPRGGVSIETTAVGHVQFGIPPETIKDSMKLGISVPSVYIVPVDRFCRDLGPALGVNLAEFEFPAYFNFFVQRKRCTLIVDSVDAERNIRRVFSETLLGPAQFRTGENVLRYEEEGTLSFFLFVSICFIGGGVILYERARGEGYPLRFMFGDLSHLLFHCNNLFLIQTFNLKHSTKT